MATSLTPILGEKILGHTGPVDRKLVEAVIDFSITLEPDEMDPNADAQYDADMRAYKQVLERGKRLVREYGASIQPQTLERLQDEYYSFTNSDKYRRDMVSCSIAAHVLSTSWEGLAGWLH